MTGFVDKCMVRGRHNFRASPARAAGTTRFGMRVISQKKCVDCKVTRSEMEDNTVRFWWSQKDGGWAD